MNNSQEQLRETFIQEIQNLAISYGWNDGLPELACSKMQLHPKSHYIWFSRGNQEILSFLEEKYDNQMLDKLKEMPNIGGITNKICAALTARICETSCSKALGKANFKYYRKPSNIAFASKITWRTVDRIWRYAGDTSTDFNYYSKRGLLYSVYLASQRRYHYDDSEGYINTKEFISLSLNQIVQTAKTTKQIYHFLHKLPVIRMFV